jgi:type I restriction-modification system DNA methylase subunit
VLEETRAPMGDMRCRARRGSIQGWRSRGRRNSERGLHLDYKLHLGNCRRRSARLVCSGKYRDVILPMTVLRRLDAVLEPTKRAVIEAKANLDKAKITNQDAALCAAAAQGFYNTSKFSLRDLRSRSNPQQLKADLEDYLDGFSKNVQDILDNFEFRNQIPRLSKADALGTLVGKFLDPSINLGADPVLNADRSVKLPGLDNHAMGTIFEELVRRLVICRKRHVAHFCNPSLQLTRRSRSTSTRHP